MILLTSVITLIFLNIQPCFSSLDYRISAFQLENINENIYTIVPSKLGIKYINPCIKKISNLEDSLLVEGYLSNDNDNMFTVLPLKRMNCPLRLKNIKYKSVEETRSFHNGNFAIRVLKRKTFTLLFVSDSGSIAYEFKKNN